MGPFRYRQFTALWCAATFSYLGSFMHVMAAAWLMTEITASKLMVALIQTASFLPFFFFTLLAGALTDKFNRRRLLLCTQSIMFITVFVLTLLVFTHHIHPWSLLAITFILNVAAGFNSPAWQMAISDIVPLEHLPNAVTLNSLSYNLARAIGPALGGIIIDNYGLGAPFVFDTLSFLGVLMVLYRWSGQSLHAITAGHPARSSFFAGFHFTWHHRNLRYACLQGILYFFAGSGIWTLLALIAKNTLKTTALGYGILFGCLGLGAVIAGLLLLRFRQRWAQQSLIQTCIFMYAVATFGLATIHELYAAEFFCLLAGFSWLAINTSFNINLQLTAPPALKARVYSVYLMLTSGAMALGSYLFGQIAAHTSSEIALLIAGMLLLLIGWLSFKFKRHLLSAA